MRIILTHEQADFDALASMLGASLLDEESIPVMPRRMNRNVSAFVTLYGEELPFIDPRDLPIEPVQHVTLVDTQSMVSVKGMGIDTRVKVVDHHPRRDGVPSDWNVTTEDTGATTTLFVEEIQERDIPVSNIQATLLILGIYEDTGSLTYTRTNARDLSAAAFLVEHGGNLQIATDFLNHPLSLQQQALYDRLRASLETIHIHGHTIVLALGDAQEIDEELATVVHKIRDLLDPDAIFLVVTIRGGIQLIARSNSDDIDVAAIVGYFGGGGHERAAAAMIKDAALNEISSDLIRILQEQVRPAITISQIMSRQPHLLPPETPVSEAAIRMQRYGYEGYPIVKTDSNGQTYVIGLLTRHAVDRAITHKLNLTAESLMDAGSYSVSPEDSIDHLQHLMTETGWGQIPVIQSENKKIIGIVTRTDLLKTLTRAPKIPGRQNLANLLESALSPDWLKLLRAISTVAFEQHMALYIVGGFVRDLILGHPSMDFDLVIEGDAIEVAYTLARRYGGHITSHNRFGTAKWHLPDDGVQIDDHKLVLIDASLESGNLKSLDLVSARTEFYTHPTALPTVERGSIKLDLHRRDFTINTLALRLDGRHFGELQDYWGGLNDLNQGVVRVLHSLSFVDDPTRMLRAIRFEKRFGFQIDERTKQLLDQARPLLTRVSGDRIRHEINHVLLEERVCEMLVRLQEFNLLQAIHNDLFYDEWLCKALRLLISNDPPISWNIINNLKGLTLKQQLSYILLFLRLSPPAFNSVVARLKIPARLVEDAKYSQQIWQSVASLVNKPPSQIVEQLKGISMISLYAIFLVGDEKLDNIIENYVFRWRQVTPYTNGHTLHQLGLPPGPRFHFILDQLRSAWLDGLIKNAEEENALLQNILEGA